MKKIVAAVALGFAAVCLVATGKPVAVVLAAFVVVTAVAAVRWMEQ